VNRLRNRLILIFLAATLAPLAATIWVTTSILEESVNLSALDKLDEVAQSLRRTGYELYQRATDDLRQQARNGAPPALRFTGARSKWPQAVQEFAAAQAPEKLVRTGNGGDRLDYLVRHGDEVWVYSAKLGVGMDRLSEQFGEGRALVDNARTHDFRHGVKLVYIILAASFWVLALGLLVYLAHRISRPIQQLTAGLSQLAAGDLNARVPTDRDDEVGRAIQAFNHMALRLQESTERLVYLRQLESWQTLARKMAHEVKNSLTPIRLTVEEMLARYDEEDRGFMEQATQIVVDEIETLERRVRAFSQFAIAFLKTAHPDVAYDCRLADQVPPIVADQDLIKGILTNLLENAAEAAGEGGRILGKTVAESGRVSIEVHDSGPGLSEQVRASLFQPTISFKKKGMGLGLSIARKSALLSGGDIVVVKGELGGAGFRVLLPVATNGIQTRPDRG
jgi:two-component system nitrogen regulation sensor histidine kinase NtrY